MWIPKDAHTMNFAQWIQQEEIYMVSNPVAEQDLRSQIAIPKKLLFENQMITKFFKLPFN